jgi:hypothetical protein
MIAPILPITRSKVPKLQNVLTARLNGHSMNAIGQPRSQVGDNGVIVPRSTEDSLPPCIGRS